MFHLWFFLVSSRLVAASHRTPVRLFGRVSENSPAGSTVEGVELLTGTGPDTCTGVDVAAGLTGNYATDFRLFRSKRNHLGLVTSKPLDREFIEKYELKVALSCLRTPAVVEVEVSDENDNVPRFTCGNQTVEVDPLTPRGSEVARFEAVDADARENGHVFFFASPQSRLLQLDSETGQVRLAGSLQGLRQVSLHVYVKDRGRSTRSSGPVLLQVQVLRRKSRSLTTEPTYTVAVAEHARVGDLVFTIPDLRFEHRRFELKSETDPPVQVEQTTGRVFLTRSLSEPAKVLVKVQKIPGDEWYMCKLSLSMLSWSTLQWTMFPSPYLTTVSPDAVPGSVVYRLSSRQTDGMPGLVQFLLLDGGVGCFEVDRQTGKIRTTGLPLTHNMEYQLRVAVEDGLGQLGPEACVSVLAGSRPPQFLESSPRVSVPENTVPGQRVAVFRAISFQNKPLTFVLVDPGNLFVLQRDSGSLSLSHSVDYESGNNVHTLRVRASEPETGLSSECEVKLYITDVNDCTPEFSSPIYTHNTVLDTVALGTSLLRVVARDCDSGENSQISYFLHDKHFDITSDGVISPARRLDYEQPDRFYAFAVAAVDAGTPPRTGSASVRIRVSRSNATSQRVYRTPLSKDAGPATLVARVPGGDAVSYTVTGNNDEVLPHRQTVVPDFTFGPGSIVHLQLTDVPSSDHTNVQLVLRTRSASGTLLSLSSQETNKSIVVQISDGLLTVLVDLGDSNHVLQFPGQRIDVGQWIGVVLTRHNNLFVVGVELDGGLREIESFLGTRTELRLGLDTMTISGALESNYQGCLKDVRLNGLQMPLDGQNRDGVVVLEQRGVMTGCTSDVCRSHKCPPPMTCVDLWRKHECRCPAGQLAVFQELARRRCVPSPCSSASCQNGGSCLAESPASFKCRCPDGFRGRHCQLGQVKGHLATLSPSSILMVSMSLLVFFALLVAVTVWNQKGSRNKFRQHAALQLPAEQLSREDVSMDIPNDSGTAGTQSSSTTAPLLQCSAESTVPSCLVSCSAPDRSSPQRHDFTSKGEVPDRPESHEDFQSDTDSDVSPLDELWHNDRESQLFELGTVPQLTQIYRRTSSCIEGTASSAHAPSQG